MIKYRISQEMIHTVVEKNTISGSIAPETTCFALLGSDLIIDEMGNIKLCECNSHPALGWGTMSKQLDRGDSFNSFIEWDEKETSFDALVVG